MKTFVLPLLFIGLAATASAEFKPAIQADVRGRYENQQSSASSNWGQSVNLLAVPAFSFGRQALLPVFAVQQQGRGVEAGVDASPELIFVRRNLFLAKPTWLYNLNDAYAVKAWGTAKRAVNAEKSDTAWSLGLYDWEEYAGGLGADYKLGGPVDKISAGLELEHRTYMNWHENGAALTAFKNYYSKDYNALKATLAAKSPAKTALPWDLSFTWLSKAYTDSFLLKKVSAAGGGETTDGTLDLDALRADQLLRLTGDISMGLGSTMALTLDYDLDWSLSNQNYFDPVFNQGVLDFYGYLSNGGGLSLQWAPQGNDGLIALVRAGLTNRVYSGRLVRNPDQSYTQGTQADLEQSYSLDLSYPFFVPGLTLVAGTSWFNALSNQGYSPGSTASYDIFEANAGLRYAL